jgi:hypothetical protein
MPKLKPSDCTVTRIELGGVERKALENFIATKQITSISGAIPNVLLGLAGATVGVGIWFTLETMFGWGDKVKQKLKDLSHEDEWVEEIVNAETPEDKQAAADKWFFKSSLGTLPVIGPFVRFIL